jgi:class 3 adenylate cyclase
LDSGSFLLVAYPHRNIRFTRTEDGFDIAFWEVGEGKPVVIVQNFGLSHAELEWDVPSIATFYMEMAERYRVIRLDPRGIGLSGEPPGGWAVLAESEAHPGLSTGAMGLDISAVAAALELDSFVLIGIGIQGPVAIEYTATHGEVSELILCDTFATVATSFMPPWLAAQSALSAVKTETGPTFSVWDKFGPPNEAGRLLNLTQASSDLVQRSANAIELWDAEWVLADVSVPTLILSIRSTELFDSLPDARHLAAGIENSRLVVLDAVHPGFAPYWTDLAATLEAIHGFLGPDTDALEPMPSGFRTVVFTDIVGSTEYVRSVGDEPGRAAVRELEQQVASLAGDHGGRVVKNLGDGSLISFGSNSEAITFALELQNACSDGPLYLRVGMAAGEPIHEDGDIHGTVVAHASRIGDLGDAGDVIVSDSVRQLAAGKGFTFEPRGEVLLKGFDEPERVWKVAPTSHA